MHHRRRMTTNGGDCGRPAVSVPCCATADAKGSDDIGTIDVAMSYGSAFSTTIITDNTAFACGGAIGTNDEGVFAIVKMSSPLLARNHIVLSFSTAALADLACRSKRNAFTTDDIATS